MLRTRKELIAAATVVSTWTGMLFDEAAGDRYYYDVEGFVECWWNDQDPHTVAPDEYFLFCTKPIHPCRVRIDDILTAIEENAEVDDLDVRERLEAVDEFGIAINAFNEKNKDVILGWDVDYTRIVRVTKTDFDDCD